MVGAELQRAGLLLEQGRFDLAEEAARRILSQAPTFALGHSFLALSLLGQQRFAEARAAAGEAIAFGPDESIVHETRARVLLACNRLKEGEDAAREAIRLDPGDPGHHYVLASALAARSRWDEALATADGGLALDPEDADLLNLRTRLLVQAGRRDEVGAASDQALRAAPEDADSHASVGWAHLNAKDYQRAFEHFREALRLDPGSGFARDGIIEAIKARNPLYALILRYFLWMGRLGAKGFYLVVGLYIGVQVLTRNLDQMPGWLRWIALGFVFCYVAFCVITWTAQPLFNLALRFHRFGRLVLSRQESRDATTLAVGLLASAGLVAAAFVIPSAKMIGIGVRGVGLSMLFAASTMHAGRRRWIMSAVVAFAAATVVHFAITVADTPADVREYPSALFVYTVLGGLIASSVLSATPARR